MNKKVLSKILSKLLLSQIYFYWVILSQLVLSEEKLLQADGPLDTGYISEKYLLW